MMFKSTKDNQQSYIGHSNDNVTTYNDDAREVLHQVMTGDAPWSHQTPRVTMSDFLDHIRSNKPNPVVYAADNDN